MMVSMEARKWKHHLWVIGVPKFIEKNDISEIGAIFKERRKMFIPGRTLIQKKEMAYSFWETIFSKSYP